MSALVVYHSVVAYLYAHPEAVAFMMTAAVGMCHKLVAKYPRLQAVAKLAQAVGLDPAKVKTAVLQLMSGQVKP